MKTILLVCFTIHLYAQSAIPAKDWIKLFNGKNLKGWSPKIKGYALNDNFAKTFRVKDKKLVVDYTGYDEFKTRYGHIFYKNEYSYYRIKLDYRFIGDQVKGGEGWAFRNSGIMIHGQPATSMTKDQDFPISIEVQFLGGKSDGTARTTCNLCTPGTHVTYQNKLDQRHCINSQSKTFDGDQWVHTELEVLGDSLIRHYVNGDLVMEYSHPIIGGGVVSNFDPAFKPDGTSITKGSISLQSESHPVEFKNIELLNLVGCMDTTAKNYKAYYVKADNSTCKYR